MSDEDGFWSALKAHKKEKFNIDRALFLSNALKEDDGAWAKHTDYHWSRMLCGQRLDYWPSRKKYQYKGKVMRGNVMKFITALEEIK